MIIVDRKNMTSRTFKNHDVVEVYKDKIAREISEIRERIMDRSYNHGSRENAERFANSEVEEYLSDKKDIYKYYLKVNGCRFRTYKTLEEAMSVFDKITEAIKNGDNLLEI